MNGFVKELNSLSKDTLKYASPTVGLRLFGRVLIYVLCIILYLMQICLLPILYVLFSVGGFVV